MKNWLALTLIVAWLLLPSAASGEDSIEGSGHGWSQSADQTPGGETTDSGGSRTCGPETMTQSTAPDLVETGSVACSPDEGVTTTENAFARCYEVGELITVNCVDFGVESSSATQDITVTIYRDSDGNCPPNFGTAEVLGSMVIEIGAISQEIVTADFSGAGGVIVEAGTAMIVEVSNPDTSGVSAFFIGSNDNGESASSYLRSDSCGLTDWDTFASVGYPDVHIVQRVDFYYGGDPPIGACCLPNGDCVDDTTPGECGDLDGDWQGEDTECTTTDCPQPPTGACCDAADGMCTDDVAEVECAGLYLGDDTVCGADCDGDGATDECRILQGLSFDCQPNGIPDECDIADGTSLDINDNGIPDECECPTGNGDGNGDAVVDLDDYAIFYDCMGGPQVAYEAGCQAMDMDGDCDVDGGDFLLFQEAFGAETGPGVIVRAELAGNSLGDYPYFQYVKAFNEDTTMEVAIDPTRFPEIVGQTCDIYVVEAKTSGGWTADPSLSDVTSGGAQTETFGGSTIQGNTFLVTGGYELDADPGIGLGVGYDVVLDCDQDGQLSDGDYIDGLGNEAGLYAIHDLTDPGPLAVTEAIYSGGSWLGQDLYYPTAISSMGQLPLIVISHGNGHNYQWYDHIGFYMASHGYIVMSHQNQTGPGIETASTTTLTNTDYIIANQGSIQGGVLDGHLDSSRITWIGHSRGAEGITRALDRIYDGTYTPAQFVLDDIALLSSMLPTDFLGPSSANPHEANYHLWTASGDADVNGSAGCDICQTFHLHDRAEKYRQSTVVQGTGHGDFHAASGSVFTGPCHIVPKPAVHDIMMGYFLPLIEHYIKGNIPAHDYLWRQYETFHPIGVDVEGNECIVVTSEYRNGADSGNFMIDDYQTAPALDESSSGGSVTFSVSNVTEGRLDDNNGSFTWSSGDPFNGATQARSSDSTKGVVFDWNGGSRYYEWEVIEGQRDFGQYVSLAFRGAQGTQHPNTLAVLGDETFTVTLRDGGGTSSSIHIGVYGGGLEQPYQRSGGWHNEMEVTRLRLTDYLNNGSGLDLSNIVAVRFEFGPSFGSNEGRIVIDELMVTNDYTGMFIALTMTLLTDPPEFIDPGVPTVIVVEIDEGTDTMVEGSAQYHYRYDGGAFITAPLVPSGGVYEATLPAAACGDTPEFYFTVEGIVTGLVTVPSGGASNPFQAYVGQFIVIMSDDFETDQGWTVENIDLTDGAWDRGIPENWGRGDPPSDYDGSDKCYLTDNDSTQENSDVDGGPTRLISPTISLDGFGAPIIRYARWFTNDDLDADRLDVHVSDDDGATWVLVESVPDTTGWILSVYNIADYVDLTSEFKVRFSATDNPNNSVTEAGIDAFEIFSIQCE